MSPELVEARPGQAARTRWGQQFDASLTDVFQVQADIATKVADALDLALADSVRAELAARPTASLAAYDAFLKGEAATGRIDGHAEPPASAGRTTSARWRSIPASCRPGPSSPAWLRLCTAIGPPRRSWRSRHGTPPSAPAGSARPGRKGSWRLASTTGRCSGTTRQALAAFQAGLKLAPSNVDLIVAAGIIEQDVAETGRGHSRNSSGARRWTLDLPTLPGGTRWPSSICAATPRPRPPRLGP